MRCWFAHDAYEQRISPNLMFTFKLSQLSFTVFCIHVKLLADLALCIGSAENFCHKSVQYYTILVVLDLCVPVTTISTRAALRSAARGDLVLPRRRRLGNRAFCVDGPAAWNSLPSDIRTASTVSTFKNSLKTHLFLQSYIL